MLSPIEITRYLENIGYTFYSVTTPLGLFKVSVWRNNEFVGIGKSEYGSHDECISTTEKDFYKKFNKDK
jgi:hypothetical protein